MYQRGSCPPRCLSGPVRSGDFGQQNGILPYTTSCPIIHSCFSIRYGSVCSGRTSTEVWKPAAGALYKSHEELVQQSVSIIRAAPWVHDIGSLFFRFCWVSYLTRALCYSKLHLIFLVIFVRCRKPRILPWHSRMPSRLLPIRRERVSRFG